MEREEKRLKFLKSLAVKLLKDCPEDTLEDHTTIAYHLKQGMADEELLNLEEVYRWPSTYSWLSGEIDYFNRKNPVEK
jgi:hypothetical protein